MAAPAMDAATTEMLKSSGGDTKQVLIVFPHVAWVAGLHEMPTLWYQEVQRVLWPKDDPQAVSVLVLGTLAL